MRAWLRVGGLLFFVVFLIACSEQRADRPSSVPDVSFSATKGPFEIRSARLAIQVSDFLVADRSIREYAEQQKGFVLRAERKRNAGNGFSGTLVVKLPVDKYRENLDFFSSLGKVFEQEEQTENVGDNVTDLALRLRNQQALEQRILTLIERPDSNLADLLQAERELARVRETIEKLQGKQQDLERRIRFATFTLNLFVTATRDMETRTWYGPFLHQLREAGRTLAGSVGMLFTVALAVLPWIFALWGLLHWRKMRRERMRLEAKKSSDVP